jgi:hypothetical protein
MFDVNHDRQRSTANVNIHSFDGFLMSSLNIDILLSIHDIEDAYVICRLKHADDNKRQHRSLLLSSMVISEITLLSIVSMSSRARLRSSTDDCQICSCTYG